MPQHQASKVRTHPFMASFVAFFPCSTKFAYCKWWLNAAETWQRGYELVGFVARYSFLHCRAGLNEARSDDVVHPGSLLRIRGGPLHGDSWTIQAPSPCNRPPSILALELRAPRGTCSGQLVQVLNILVLCNDVMCKSIPCRVSPLFCICGQSTWGEPYVVNVVLLTYQESKLSLLAQRNSKKITFPSPIPILFCVRVAVSGL